MDVVVWLRSLGLGKYEAAFREIERDGSCPIWWWRTWRQKILETGLGLKGRITTIADDAC